MSLPSIDTTDAISQSNLENNKQYIKIIEDLSTNGINHLGHKLKLIDTEKFLVDTKCAICREQYNDDDEIYQLSCRHVFHAKCDRVYREIKTEEENKEDNCAVCKQPVVFRLFFKSMLSFVNQLLLKCEDNNCYYFFNKLKVDDFNRILKLIMSCFHGVEENTSVNISNYTVRDEQTNRIASCLFSEDDSQYQVIYSKLFALLKLMFDEKAKPISLPVIATVLCNQLNGNNILQDFCPYPELKFKNSVKHEFFKLNHAFICDYVCNIFTYALPVGIKIASYYYENNSIAGDKIGVTIDIRNTRQVLLVLHEVDLKKISTTGMHIVYNIHKIVMNHICLIKLEEQFPKLVEKDNSLFLEYGDCISGIILFKYKNKEIRTNMNEFYDYANKGSIDIRKFKHALIRRNIDIKSLS